MRVKKRNRGNEFKREGMRVRVGLLTISFHMLGSIKIPGIEIFNTAI